MSHRLWLLIEWLGENEVFSSYGVVNTDSLMGEETNFDIGKIIYVPNKHSNGVRRAKILRISEKKSNVKELKILLEKQDNQMKNVLSLCMNTLNDMKTTTMFLDPPPTRQENRDSSDDDVEKREKDLKFSKLANKFTSKRVNLLSTRLLNMSDIKQTPFSSHRSLMSSTPFPESSKLTFDQATQTDESLDPNTPKIEQLEALLNRLYQQFLSLIGEATTNDSWPVLPAEYSETEISEVDQNMQRSEEVTKREVTNTDLLASTPLVDNSQDKVKQAKRLCIRRASAQTTNTGLPTSDDTELDADMIQIGGGSTKLPVTVLNAIDWSSYTTATRQLLKAIFPRKVLATHSLTGKQSPAFSNKPPKKALDASVVSDIVNTVSEVCGVSKRIVRSCITTKCTDEAKLYRNRQRYKQNNGSRENNEDTKPSASSPSTNDLITKTE